MTIPSLQLIVGKESTLRTRHELCLPDPGDVNRYEVSETQFNISGWGSLFSGGQSPDILNVATVPFVPDKMCRESYGSDRVSPRMICAGDVSSGGIDSCRGDSGGPLAWKDTLTNEWKIVGIVSWGIGCGQVDFPGVYAEVKAVLEWITANTGDNCDASAGLVNAEREFTSFDGHCWDDRMADANGIALRFDDVTVAQVSCATDPDCRGVYVRHLEANDRRCQGNEVYLCRVDTVYQPSNTSCVLDKQYLEEKFRKTSSVFCGYDHTGRYGTFGSLTDAKNTCSNDGHCRAIYNRHCNSTTFELCSHDAVYKHSNSSSCVYDNVYALIQLT